jgi:hypothetical protein
MPLAQAFTNPARKRDLSRISAGRRVQVLFFIFIMDYIDSSLYRYLRALAALYIRMTFRAVDVYELLEPLLKDYRKLRLRNMCKHVVDTPESCFDFPP